MKFDVCDEHSMTRLEYLMRELMDVDSNNEQPTVARLVWLWIKVTQNTEAIKNAEKVEKKMLFSFHKK